ncbi:hypothetical protein GCM10011384_09600 [Psychrobacillus lasiicapitis]|nr:hypothetical protein GCM10011384_09600 [Psychrobacillus lasiicapitis]
MPHGKRPLGAEIMADILVSLRSIVPTMLAQSIVDKYYYETYQSTARVSSPA